MDQKQAADRGSSQKATFRNTYTKIEQIGEGTSGQAILVKHNVEKKFYIAKKIKIDDKDISQLQELQILQRLEHPNIVKFKEYFVEKQRLIIVMEYCEEGDLAFHIELKQKSKESFSADQILNWMTQIILALNYLHQQKIIHRDIKSSNIFLTSGGTVKVGDFGISKQLKYTLEKAKSTVGTPYYLSPEICNNLPYTSKSDIWALGCLVYELCTLKQPFNGANIIQLITQITTSEAPDIPTPQYSEALRDTVKLLLSKNPDLRPSARELLSRNIITDTMSNYLEVTSQRIELIKEKGASMEESLPLKKLGVHKKKEEIMIQSQKEKPKEPEKMMQNSKELTGKQPEKSLTDDSISRSIDDIYKQAELKAQQNIRKLQNSNKKMEPDDQAEQITAILSQQVKQIYGDSMSQKPFDPMSASNPQQFNNNSGYEPQNKTTSSEQSPMSQQKALSQTTKDIQGKQYLNKERIKHMSVIQDKSADMPVYSQETGQQPLENTANESQLRNQEHFQNSFFNESQGSMNLSLTRDSIFAGGRFSNASNRLSHLGQSYNQSNLLGTTQQRNSNASRLSNQNEDQDLQLGINLTNTIRLDKQDLLQITQELNQTRGNDLIPLMQFEYSMAERKPILKSEMNPFESTAVMLQNIKMSQQKDPQPSSRPQFIKVNQIKTSGSDKLQSEESNDLEVRDDYEDDFENNSEDESNSERNQPEKNAPALMESSQFSDENNDLLNERISKDNRQQILQEQVNAYEECIFNNSNISKSAFNQMMVGFKNINNLKNFQATQ